MDGSVEKRPRKVRQGFSRKAGKKLAEIARARQRVREDGMRQCTEETRKFFCINCPRVVGALTLRYFASANGMGDAQELEILAAKEGIKRIDDRRYLCGECTKIPGLFEKLCHPGGYTESSEMKG